MRADQRIRRIRLIEKINENREFSIKLGLNDKSYFKEDSVHIKKEEKRC